MTIKEIIKEVSQRNSFKEVKIDEFAPDGGWADIVAKNFDKTKTTQLRKVFTMIKHMEQRVKGLSVDTPFNEPELFMLIPHLAYAKARGVFKSDEFYELIKVIIGNAQRDKKIKTVGDFTRFSDFMMAVIAYHKYHTTTKEGQRNER